jgi:hypothetical protein
LLHNDILAVPYIVPRESVFAAETSQEVVAELQSSVDFQITSAEEVSNSVYAAARLIEGNLDVSNHHPLGSAMIK